MLIIHDLLNSDRLVLAPVTRLDYCCDLNYRHTLTFTALVLALTLWLHSSGIGTLTTTSLLPPTFQCQKYESKHQMVQSMLVTRFQHLPSPMQTLLTEASLLSSSSILCTSHRSYTIVSVLLTLLCCSNLRTAQFSDARLRRFNMIAVDSRVHGETGGIAGPGWGRQAAAADLHSFMVILHTPIS